MNYILLHKRFWKLDAEEHFGASATRLYFFLVEECNRQRWASPFYLALSQLHLILGMTKSTIVEARKELEARNLIKHTTHGNGKGGRGNMSAYQLLTEDAGAGSNSLNSVPFSDEQKGEKPSQCSPENSLNSGPFLDDADDSNGLKDEPFSSRKGPTKSLKSDLFPSEKGPTKCSNFRQPLYKEENENSSVVENEDGEAAPTARAGELNSTLSPTHYSAEPQAERGTRRPGAHDEELGTVDADNSPLSKPDVFRAICIDEGYAQIDFEHYRLTILNDSRDQKLQLSVIRWRRRIRRWLENAKADGRLILAGAPTTRTQYGPAPDATKSSADPSQKKNWTA